MDNVIVIGMVSDEVRRAHSRALARRDRWRDRYAVLTGTIRRAKSRLRLARLYNNYELERSELEVLRALRLEADFMMLRRAEIREELRDTAYAYAPREVIESVAA